MKNELLSIAKVNKANLIVDKLNNLSKDSYKTSVAFLGEFSSGKTTLVNALIKKQFLPSFDKPTTAIITEIIKGKETTFEILENSNGQSSSKTIEVSEIAEEVQKEGFNRFLKVKINDSDLLDENTILIDTPGVSSINETHSKVTYGYLPNMDVVFMVVNINMGSISKSLEAFIDNCPENIRRKLYFVLNFKDTKSPSQIEKLVTEFKSSVKDLIADAKIIVVSSRDALKANLTADIDLYNKSGVNIIEEIIKIEIPKLHSEIAEKRYLESLESIKKDLIFFLQEKESNLFLDKSEFLKKIEDLKIEKQELKKGSDKIKRDLDLIKSETENTVQRLNKNMVSRFIQGLNNDSLDPITAQYTKEFTSVLESKLVTIENYDLPQSILDNISSSTVGGLRDKVGTWFEISNKLPMLINSGAIALATGGTSLAANVAEVAVVHTVGKAIDLAEKNLTVDKTLGEVSKTINESDYDATNNSSKNTENIKTISKRRAVATTILTVLDQLNVTEFAKNKINESIQKNNVYNALKDNSNQIIEDVFKGINTIVNQRIDIEINQPLLIKEDSINVVKEELSSSLEDLNNIKKQISKDLISLYK